MRVVLSNKQLTYSIFGGTVCFSGEAEGGSELVTLEEGSKDCHLCLHLEAAMKLKINRINFR